MTEPNTPIEWGVLAASIPGYDWLPGMIDQSLNRYTGGGRYPKHHAVPNPDDPATAGCLLALLGPGWCCQHDVDGWAMWGQGNKGFRAPTLGRACVAAAAALGRWPGGSDG